MNENAYEAMMDMFDNWINGNRKHAMRQLKKMRKERILDITGHLLQYGSPEQMNIFSEMIRLRNKFTDYTHQ